MMKKRIIYIIHIITAFIIQDQLTLGWFVYHGDFSGQIPILVFAFIMLIVDFLVCLLIIKHNQINLGGVGLAMLLLSGGLAIAGTLFVFIIMDRLAIRIITVAAEMLYFTERLAIFLIASRY